MKYTYSRSKTYKLKNKLKILLTILLAVLISTTGYLLSNDVLSKLDYEYFNETTNDGINIKVVGERGVIPNDSTLKIEKVSKKEKSIVDNSINEIKDNNINTVKSYTYDIKILDPNNNEIEPSKEIKIIFTNDLINNKNLNTNIYHTSTDKENNLTTEVLKGEVEGETITTTTDSFSYYTVAFTYNNKTYNLGGDEEVKLDEILNTLELTGEVTNVESSNNELFYPDLREDGYYIVSIAPFDTEEYLNITIDNIVYKIDVTDATLSGSLNQGTFTFTYTISNAPTKTTVTLTKITFKATKAVTYDQYSSIALNYGVTESDRMLLDEDILGSWSRTSSISSGTTVTIFSGSKSRVLDRGYDNKTAYIGVEAAGMFSAFSGGNCGSTIVPVPGVFVAITIPKLPEYTITYNGNGGTFYSGDTYTETKTAGLNYIVTYVKPSRNFYTFDKWTTNSDGTGTSYTSGSTYTGNANLTLYAQWKEGYQINYHMNMDTCNTYISSQTKEVGVNITLSSTIPTAPRYTFQKWNTKEDGSGVNYNPGDTYTNDATLDLYAVWTENDPSVIITKNWVDGLTGSDAENRPNPTLKISKYLSGEYQNTSGTNLTYTDNWDWLAILTIPDKVIFTYDYTETETQFSATITKIQFNCSSGTTKTFTSDGNEDNRLAIEFDGTVLTYWSGTIAANTTTTIWSGSKTITVNKSRSSSSLSSKCHVRRVKDQSGVVLVDSGDLAVTVPGLTYFTISSEELVKSTDSQWKYNLYPDMNAENSNMEGWYVWEETVPNGYISNHPLSSPVQISSGAASVTNTIGKQLLTISETVKGSISNINKNFTFTLNVINNSVGISGNYPYTGTRSGTLTFTNGNATFNLKHGENLAIELPKNCTYTITQNSDGYTLAKTNDSGTLSSDTTSTFTDTLEGTTPTGIFLDLIPFIVLITFGILGIFLIRKFKYI